MDMSPPLKFLDSELQTDNVAQSILAISRLRTISLALGADKTRDELIPYLTKIIEDIDDKLTDEVKVTIAEILGSFGEFVGGAAQAHCLIKPLVGLCKVEETTVREKAVASINKIGAQLSTEQLQAHVFPAFTALSIEMDWFTPRVSACGLGALAYKGAGDANRNQVADKFCSLGGDESPMVRRAAAKELAGFAAVLQAEHLSYDSDQKAGKQVLSVHQALLADEQESVRVNAVKAIPAICQRVLDASADASLIERILQDFIKTQKDKSWRVRNACAEVIADVATAACAKSAAHTEKLQQAYLDLAHDTECELRISSALKGDAVAGALGADFGAQHVFNIVYNLVQDPNSASRVELAAVLAKLAGPLGKRYTEELILPQIELLALEEFQNMNVRLAVINQFDGIIDVVGLESQPKFLELIAKLGSDAEKKWRIRHAILLLLPKLAAEIGAVELTKHFDLNGFAKSPFAKVREEFALVLPALAATLGVPWLIEDVVPIFAECAKEKAYQLKTSLLAAMVGLAQTLDAEQLEAHFLTHAFGFLSDSKAPNLRLRTVEALRAVAVQCPELTAKIKEAVAKLTDDDDDDVRKTASDF